MRQVLVYERFGRTVSVVQFLRYAFEKQDLDKCPGPLTFSPVSLFARIALTPKQILLQVIKCAKTHKMALVF